jgi:hypothetical protein
LDSWWWDTENPDDLTPFSSSLFPETKGAWAALKAVMQKNYTRNTEGAALNYAKGFRLDPGAWVDMLVRFPRNERHVLTAITRALAVHDPLVLRLMLRRAFRERPRETVALCMSSGIPYPTVDVIEEAVKRARDAD